MKEERTHLHHVETINTNDRSNFDRRSYLANQRMENVSKAQNLDEKRVALFKSISNKEWKRLKHPKNSEINDRSAPNLELYKNQSMGKFFFFFQQLFCSNFILFSLFKFLDSLRRHKVVDRRTMLIAIQRRDYHLRPTTDRSDRSAPNLILYSDEVQVNVLASKRHPIPEKKPHTFMDSLKEGALRAKYNLKEDAIEIKLEMKEAWQNFKENVSFFYCEF